MSTPAHWPRKGQVWEVIEDCDVPIQYLFSAPITFSGTGRLAVGERVCITTDAADSQLTVVSFLPVRYQELHDRLVPPDMRDTPRYKKYELSLKPDEFQKHFRVVDDVA